MPCRTQTLDFPSSSKNCLNHCVAWSRLMCCLSCSVAFNFFNLESPTSPVFHKTASQNWKSPAWLFGTIAHKLGMSAYFLMIRFKLIHFARVPLRQYFVLPVASRQEPWNVYLITGGAGFSPLVQLVPPAFLHYSDFSFPFIIHK